MYEESVNVLTPKLSFANVKRCIFRDSNDFFVKCTNKSFYICSVIKFSYIFGGKNYYFSHSLQPTSSVEFKILPRLARLNKLYVIQLFSISKSGLTQLSFTSDCSIRTYILKRKRHEHHESEVFQDQPEFSHFWLHKLRLCKPSSMTVYANTGIKDVWELLILRMSGLWSEHQLVYC